MYFRERGWRDRVLGLGVQSIASAAFFELFCLAFWLQKMISKALTLSPDPPSTAYSSTLLQTCYEASLSSYPFPLFASSCQIMSRILSFLTRLSTFDETIIIHSNSLYGMYCTSGMFVTPYGYFCFLSFDCDFSKLFPKVLVRVSPEGKIRNGPLTFITFLNGTSTTVWYNFPPDMTMRSTYA